ncbi:MarR family winged helix-turn-helix transcriptional regulator [Methanolobus vulcani]|uniref:MarR family transcriptional regulator n=1 Tax=Methanolobus vulcani TaxID=38026 RepID=A0A7Z8P1G4_9EURY|nr:MarR family transcriptional regulator [Methanolobus vulcani]TQD24371.1 MarR family transcriptional regulator [Methanolobus vulcani]
MDELPLAAFISITYRSQFVKINNQMKEFDLSAGQFFVLMVLSRHQGITQDTLSCALLIDKGSIARAVRVLENKGFVKRVTDETNRRAVRVYLTKKGEQLIPKVSKFEEEMEEASLSGLTEDEKKQTKILLKKIAQNCYEAAYKNGDRKWKDFPPKDL